MEPQIQKQLLDRTYEKRKIATLDLERQVRDCLARGDHARIDLIVQQLCALLVSTSASNLNARNGGLIGLAGLGIALGQEIAPYLQQIVPPILQCFGDHDSKIRFFACESFYNIAKVCKGEILVFFNEIFDALSKLAADSEVSVRNGAELLDRLLKDIVSEAAPHYVSRAQDIPHIRAQQDARDGVAGGSAELDVAREKARFSHGGEQAADRAELELAENKAFSLARFVPLLAERIYVVSPFTRNFLVSWITVLDSVPQLELVSFLPSFLDGLLKYLSDPNTDVRVATANVLADFLKEIKEAAEKRQLLLEEEQRREQVRIEREQGKAAAARKAAARGRKAAEPEVGADDKGIVLVKPVPKRKSVSKGPALPPSSRSFQEAETENADAGEETPSTSPSKVAAGKLKEGKLDGDVEISNTHAEVSTDTVVNKDEKAVADTDGTTGSVIEDEVEEEEPSIEEPLLESWELGHEVRVDYAEIVEILLDHVSSSDEEIQATALHWISELLLVVQDVIVPFAPRLIPTILPTIAHHSLAIQTAANATNVNLYRVIQLLPSPPAPPPSQQPLNLPTTGTPIRPLSSAAMREHKTAGGSKDGGKQSAPLSPRIRAVQVLSGDASAHPGFPPESSTPRQTGFGFPASPQFASAAMFDADGDSPVQPEDQFDYHATVIALTLQLLDEHEETRVAALEWLLMLHAKAPRKILVMDDGTFPALLKTLSDPSEEVIKGDLRLLAQISSASEDSYFYSFMANLLSLFSTDRRLLETRGSLIIRQLCSSLHTERIYRTMAEIIEKEEDLEFASIMVQNLNIILITSPELADFRKRLRTLETKDGSALFCSLYRSWSHNAVATFSLCLLAQAYEHASNLLSIFADLEITVPLLIQIDKLVQLLESPVFTSLRLQLLEPERYPYLFKCLYGLLMLLPQSSAFATLRNRLNAVSSLGFLQTVPRGVYPSSSTGAAGVGSASTSSGTTSATRSKMMGRDDQVRWNELILHFRSVQLRHERARRAALSASQASDRMFLLSMEGNQPGKATKLASTSSSIPANAQPPRRRAAAGTASSVALSISAARSTNMSPLKTMRVSGYNAQVIPEQVSASGLSSPFFGSYTVANGSEPGGGAPETASSRPMSPSVGGSANRKGPASRSASTKLLSSLAGPSQGSH